MRLAATLLLLLLISVVPAAAQQAVRIKVDGGTPDTRVDIPGTIYRPATNGPAPAVALFHGCGGVGVNLTRMADILKSWGYVALLVDSFSSRGTKEICGWNKWPTAADAEKRALDIDAAALWLAGRDYVDSQRMAFMAYSYGGGVGLFRTLTAKTDSRLPTGWRAGVLVYPDCDLADGIGPRLRPRQPTLVTVGELDDWTPVARCRALFDRIVADRDMVDLRIYPGAHHSFDALGLAVRYFEGAGNSSKPNRCCGAHYGAHEPTWRAFVADVKAFLEKNLAIKR
jgi:dienelactone hydrolase